MQDPLAPRFDTAACVHLAQRRLRAVLLASPRAHFFALIQFFLCPSHSVNITLGPKEDRVLITGLHTVADVYCNSCQTVLGWKYVSRTPS